MVTYGGIRLALDRRVAAGRACRWQASENDQYDVLTGEETKKLAYSMLNEKQKLKFEQNWELDFSFGIEQYEPFSLQHLHAAR